MSQKNQGSRTRQISLNVETLSTPNRRQAIVKLEVFTLNISSFCVLPVKQLALPNS